MTQLKEAEMVVVKATFAATWAEPPDTASVEPVFLVLCRCEVINCQVVGTWDSTIVYFFLKLTHLSFRLTCLDKPDGQRAIRQQP